MHRRELIDDLLQDARYAARGLRRAPAFTAVVVLTLGLGLGATTAIFSAVDALILRPLPYREPERLMHVTLTYPDLPTRKGTDDGVWSYPKFLVFRQTQAVFDDLALYSEAQFNIAMGSAGEAERVRGEWITRGYLPTLGLSVERGRNFSAADDHPDAPREAIISDALWQRRFNADPATIGRVIDVNREPFTIIGVMPPGFGGLWGNGDLFLPITALSASALGQPASHSYEMVARRKAGITETQARNAVTILGAQIDRTFPDRRFPQAMGAAARPLDDARVAPQVKRSVVVLFGAVAFVLLIACVNVANLLVGRAESRRREIAIRLAIGAGRGRLIRLLLIESLLLATAGGALGVVVAWLGVHAMAAANPAAVQMRAGIVGLGIIGLNSIHLDMQALVFTLGLTLSVGIVFGLAPALSATNPSVTGALKSASGKNGARHVQARWLLVIAEVALSVVLLAGSGLMIRSLTKLVEIEPGFDVTNVLTARLALPGGAIKRDSLPVFHRELLDRVSALPGVVAASLGDSPPLAGTNGYTKINLMDRPPVEFSLMPSVSVVWATASWFDVLRVPLKRGRMFASTDRAGAPSVVLVSEAGARKFWPGEKPIGKRVAIGMGGFDEAHGGAEVIGVVGDVHTRPDSLPGPTLYLPYAQSPQSRIILFIRTAVEPTSLTAPLRAAVHDLAPEFPLYDIQTMAARTATATASARFSSGLLGLFSIIALALASVGIYGVMAVLVGQRTKEIGIRMAVGADARTIVAMVVGQGLRVTAIGTAIGLVFAVVLTRFLRTLLFEVSTTDPPAYVLATLVFGAAAALASWIPARRAARVDPLESLRTE
jgi:predicted permease